MIDRFGVVGVVVVCLLLAVAPVALAQAPGEPEGTNPSPDDPFIPLPCVGTYFADVTCSTPFDAWIEQFARDGITAGCGGGNYCPDNAVSRAQMAVFIEKAMRGTASWTPAGTTPDLARLAVLNRWGGPYSGSSYGFNGPALVAFDGIHLWVASYEGHKVTAIKASDGSWVRTVSGDSCGIDGPLGVAFDGTHVWVANHDGNSVTEILAR